MREHTQKQERQQQEADMQRRNNEETATPGQTGNLEQEQSFYKNMGASGEKK